MTYLCLSGFQMNCSTNEKKQGTNTERSIKTSAVEVIKQTKCSPETGCIQEGGEKSEVYH